MTFVLALIIAAGIASANETSCGNSAPIALPPLSPATRDDVGAVRALIDAHQIGAARTRWAKVAATGGAAYGRADMLFSAGRYRAAFTLYDRALFCAQFSELNPSAQDSGAAQLLDRALRQAAAANFGVAERLLQQAEERDPASIESRYFLGLVAFARADRRAARADWKAAIDDEGYAQPPDGWTMTRAQEAAVQRYLGVHAVDSRGEW